MMSLSAEQQVLMVARERLPELDELADRTTLRLAAMQSYVREYRQYCWPVNSIDDFKLAPFHLLASEGAVHVDKPHTWHTETLAQLCAADTKLLLATPFKIVDANDVASWRVCDCLVDGADLHWPRRHGGQTRGLYYQRQTLCPACDQVSWAGVPAHHLWP